MTNGWLLVTGKGLSQITHIEKKRMPILFEKVKPTNRQRNFSSFLLDSSNELLDK